MTKRTEVPLFPFQVDGVQALLSQPALLLADDMGLGKTLQSIAALRSLLDSGDIRSALVVVPAGLMRQWRAELDRWAPDVSVICLDGSYQERQWKWGLTKQLYLISYESLRNDLGKAMSFEWDLVILDEAQRIKNRDTDISRACKKLVRARAWALTGTPLENREDELGSLLEFVRPTQAGVRTIPIMPGPRLRSLQSQLQLRRRKCDVLKELPPKTNIRVPIEMTAAQRRSYREAEAGLVDHLNGLGTQVRVINVLQVISKLKAICNFCPRSGESAKLADLRRRLQILSRSGQRALVFSQWKNQQFGVSRLHQELQEFQPLVYSGDLDLQQRQARIRDFQERPEHAVLLISLKAGGQGLNLQAASYVFHFDRWWNPAVENQATDRAHRMGQVNPVTVYSYTTLDSIEERIENILDAKLALFADIVDRVTIDPGKLLSPGELYGLLGLEPPPTRAAVKARPGQPLLKMAKEVLIQNRWHLMHSTPNTLRAERMDELGWLETVNLLSIAPTTHETVLEEFLIKTAGTKRVILAAAEDKQRVKQLAGDRALCWDETALESLSLSKLEESTLG